ncbi:MAG: gamma-glutamyltransferase [Gammaproteobacteria bacterium]|nr:gamma-glutamyltransferase [Gammaproteobacteria bacterium]MCF6230453.1 gamma-glutamyltransferase [Gammaproteobacteria bacterium]
MQRTLSLITLFFASGLCLAQASPPQAAVASAHPLATQAGIEILEQGGNAFDAAVAVTAALAVVEPTGSGLGGGGFWLIHDAQQNRAWMIDGREMAPGKAHRNMYLDAQGEVIPNLSMNGPLAAGIPGTPAAMEYLANQYGKLPLSQSLSAAIRYAEHGFNIDKPYQRMAKFRLKALQDSPAAAATFLEKNQPPTDHFILKQPDLANTLKAIATLGAKGFYQGDVAKRLIDGVQQAGGIWTHQDLENYTLIVREPIRSQYRNITLTSAALPSSGGIVLSTMLNILEGYPLDSMDGAQRTHLIVEAMRRAYRDRAEYLGDGDFIEVPQQLLTSKQYAAGLRAAIHPSQATPSKLLPGAMDDYEEGRDTTHFSIIDTQGNRVSATMSINYPFGSGFVPPGTGVLLNDEMDDFSSKPGTPNAYGLVGAEANAIEAGKRPLSSMTPSFLETAERVAILGTPGGSRIISMLLLATLEFAENSSVDAWVSRPRFHHQYLPDQIQYEPGALSNELIRDLQARGHEMKQLNHQYGGMQAILWDKKTDKVTAASDPRGIGSAQIQ